MSKPTPKDFSLLTPHRAKPLIETCLMSGLVPFLQGSPGICKSALFREICKEYNLYMIDVRLSAMEPTDLVGLPWIQDGKAKFNPFEFFPIEGSKPPAGYDGWMLFLDEFNSASRATQAAAYRIILDHEIGQYKLSNRCLVAAAGNKATDNAIVNRLSTAMASRVVHFNIEPDFESWRNDFAIPHKIDERVIAYLSFSPDKLWDFNPDSDAQTFPCPRTWEFVSKLIKSWDRIHKNTSISALDTKIIPLLAGAITYEQANAFVQYTKVYDKLVTITDLKNNPDIAVPEGMEVLWAILMHMVSQTTKDNFKLINSYIKKFPTTFQVIYYRSIDKNPDMEEISLTPEYTQTLVDLGDYLFGEEN